MRALLVSLSFALLATAPLGCGPAASSPGDMAVGGPSALFSVPAVGSPTSVTSLPWPSDLYLDAGGHIALATLQPLQEGAAHAAILADVHARRGFAVSAGAFFPISAAVDAASIDGRVKLLDLDADGEVPVTTTFRGGGELLLHARPAVGHVLLQEHHYAYVLLKGITSGGVALSPGADFLAVREAREGSSPSDPRLARAFDTHARLLARLDRGAPARADVIAAAAFTTQNITGTLEQARAVLQALPAPVAKVGYLFAASPQAGATGSLDDLLGATEPALPGRGVDAAMQHEAMGWVVQGTFDSPDFLAHTKPSIDGKTPTVSVLGKLTSPQVDGPPAAQGTASVPFTLVLPSKPAGGSFADLPVIVFQHGLAGDRRAAVYVGNTFARSGIATLCIDLPFHGMRGAGAVDQKRNGSGGVGPDGFADLESSGAPLLFFDVMGDVANGVAALDPAVLRSNFQQASIDIMSELRLVTHGSIAAVAALDPRLASLSFRKGQVVFAGESFGSIMGGIVMGVEPDLGAAMLSVGGGGLVVPLLTWSAVYGPIFGILLDSALGTNASDSPIESDFGFNVVETLLEPGDPLAFAPYAIDHPIPGASPRHVLMLNAWLDESVPNVANQSLAGALGVGFARTARSGTPHLSFLAPAPAVMAAPVAGNRMVGGKPITAVMVEYESATHGMVTNQKGTRTVDATTRPYKKLPAPVAVDNPIQALQDSMASFATDFYAGRVPSLIDHP